MRSEDGLQGIVFFAVPRRPMHSVFAGNKPRGRAVVEPGYSNPSTAAMFKDDNVNAAAARVLHGPEPISKCGTPFVLAASDILGACILTKLFSPIPNTATVSYTSNLAHNDIGTYFGLCLIEVLVSAHIVVASRCGSGRHQLLRGAGRHRVRPVHAAQKALWRPILIHSLGI